jgi:hypothetical protein
MQVISSSTSDTSSADNVVGHVLIDAPVVAKSNAHDLEAGQGLERSGSGRGLALPFTPMSVAFKDISYFVPHPGVSHSTAAAFAYEPWAPANLSPLLCILPSVSAVEATSIDSCQC